jgi:hypothetical protein
MKALSLWQPHATAIDLGLKPYETRGWSTAYRGPLVICAAKKVFRHQDYPLDYYQEVCGQLKRAGCPHYALPYGQALCVVDLVDCIPTSKLRGRIGRIAEFWGDFTDGELGRGRFAFKLENLRRLEPRISVVGRQGFFDVALEGEASKEKAATNLSLFSEASG